MPTASPCADPSEAAGPAVRVTSMDAVVATEQLTKDYGSVLALDALTLTIGPGTTGLVGANGPASPPCSSSCSG